MIYYYKKDNINYYFKKVIDFFGSKIKTINEVVFVRKRGSFILVSFIFSLMVVGSASAATLFTENFGTGTDWTTNLPAGWAASDDATSGMDDQLSITGGSDGNRYAWIIGNSVDQDITRAGISTAGYQNLKISYAYNLYPAFASGDFLIVEWKKNSDVSFTTAGIIQKVTGVSGWNTVTFNLPASAANTLIDLRFRAEDTEAADYVLIDNVQVTGNLIADCGDGNIDNGEECDNGILNNDNSACSSKCTKTFCGDGISQNPNGNQQAETCDDGNLNNNDECDNNCGITQIPCGNDMIDEGEDCELPGTPNNNYCSQTTTDCQGTKQATRDNKGNCDSSCLCLDDSFSTYQCVKDVCGATCDSNDDCNDQNPNTVDTCNLDSCGCENTPTLLCGNGIINPPSEQCDGSNLDEQTCLTLGFDGGTLSCNQNCNFGTSSCFKCGDGTINQGEQCDDSNTFPNDACTGTCQNAVCGDGIIRDGVEECDDGNTQNNDGCSSLCILEEKEACTQSVDVMLVIDRSGSMDNNCGPDGIAQPGETPCNINDAKSAAITFINEMDFLKDKVGLASFNEAATLDQPLTNNNILITNKINALVAGGGTNIGGGIDTARLELVANGGATKAIILLSDGAPNVYPGGFCDEDTQVSTPCTQYALDQSNIAKAAGIRIFVIGLGVNTFTENLLKDIASSPSDYFSAPTSSELESIYLQIAQIICPCGNGIEEPQLGEECDDGNELNYDACTNTCEDAVCGDNILHIGVEQCDDGKNGINTDECTDTCTLTYCGDSFEQHPNGVGLGGPNDDGNEQCDDGNQIYFDGCLNNCVDNICGDGYVNIGVEECDDGNTQNDDGCSSTCETESVCGNGIVEAGEDCDDTNQDPSDLCSNDCKWTFCGDIFEQHPNGLHLGGPLNDGNEDCDDGNQQNTDACLNTCTDASCGDGFIHSGVEQCESPDTPNNQNCANGPQQQCLGTKLGTRDQYGNCNSACGCIEDNFVYQCVEGECGAACDSNDDCDDKDETTIDTCNLDGCSCVFTPIELIKKDSKVAQAMPTANFGLGRYMMVNPKQGATDRSYIRIDTSQLNSLVNTANLSVAVYQTGGSTIGTQINAYYCKDHDFVETTINWQNQPLDNNCALADTFTILNEVVAGSPLTWHSFDLTNETNFEEASGDGLFTIVLRSTEESTGVANNKKYVQYLTKDYSEAAFRPKLEVT